MRFDALFNAVVSRQICGARNLLSVCRLNDVLYENSSVDFRACREAAVPPIG
jgi:hypothetical protein